MNVDGSALYPIPNISLCSMNGNLVKRSCHPTLQMCQIVEIYLKFYWTLLYSFLWIKKDKVLVTFGNSKRWLPACSLTFRLCHSKSNYSWSERIHYKVEINWKTSIWEAYTNSLVVNLSPNLFVFNNTIWKAEQMKKCFFYSSIIVCQYFYLTNLFRLQFLATWFTCYVRVWELLVHCIKRKLINCLLMFCDSMQKHTIWHKIVWFTEKLRKKEEGLVEGIKLEWWG